jgi:hypothetical protein
VLRVLVPFPFPHWVGRHVVPMSSPVDFFGSTTSLTVGCHPMTAATPTDRSGGCPAPVVAGVMGHTCPLFRFGVECHSGSDRAFTRTASPPAVSLEGPAPGVVHQRRGVETTVGDGITTYLDPSRRPRASAGSVIDVVAETFEQTHHGTHHR